MRPTLTHIALHCRDFPASLAFYRDFCGLHTVHERRDDASGVAVTWLAEPGKEQSFIFVLISGGPGHAPTAGDFGHFGFALASRAEVEAVAARAQAAGCLLWTPRDEPFPVGYYCGVSDPDGNCIEFSYGQPLGPGAADKASR